jgi:hypothetical protein
MKISQILTDSFLTEFLEPAKPNKTTTSTIKKAGPQGSTYPVKQLKFTTANGNVVKLHIKPETAEDGTASVNGMFYVNNTLYDDSSASEASTRDTEILPGVFYTLFAYLDRARINHCTFTAYSGSRDTKTKFNVPLDRDIRTIGKGILALKNRISGFVVTQSMVDAAVAKRNATLQKLGRPLVDNVTIIYKPELLQALQDLAELVGDVFPALDASNIQAVSEHYVNAIAILTKYNHTVREWPEYTQLITDLHSTELKLRTYYPGGAAVTQNRRFNVYSKLLNKYYSSNWTINTSGDTFHLTRKNLI